MRAVTRADVRRVLRAGPYRHTRRFLRRHHSTVLARIPGALLPPGWSSGPPDFVGVGAQRCGTTWWYRAIELHPEVQRVPASPKERNFFDRFASEPFTDRSVVEYHRLFPRRSGRPVGEWTPAYLHDFWVPPLLHRAAPQARILVLLRDPVERYLSGVTADEAGRRRSDFATSAFSRGLYHEQLLRVLDHFPRDRVLVLQYERCRDDPAGELERTYAFLGLDDTRFRPAILEERVNATRVPKLEPDKALLAALRAGYRRDAERLFRDFPELDASLWTTLSGGAPPAPQP